MRSSFVGRSHFVIGGLLFAAVLGGCVDGEDTSELGQETAGSGAAGTILANSNLGDAEIEVNVGGHVGKVEGDTQLVTQTITIQPGGHTGWHTHGGMAFVSISAGTLTLFDSHAPCTGTAYATGKAFFDQGGGEVHIARNLGTTPATVYVQYILPAGAPARIDAPAPAGAELCP